MYWRLYSHTFEVLFCIGTCKRNRTKYLRIMLRVEIDFLRGLLILVRRHWYLKSP